MARSPLCWGTGASLYPNTKGKKQSGHARLAAGEDDPIASKERMALARFVN